jgi:hypothetical protein
MSQSGSAATAERKTALESAGRRIDACSCNSDIQSPEDVLRVLKNGGIEADPATKNLIKAASFPREEAMMINSIVHRAEHLGYREGESFLGLLERVKEEHALLDLHPRGAIVSRVCYEGQPSGETVYVSMEPIRIGGKSAVFVLRASQQGKLWLAHADVGKIELSKGTLILCRLPKSG